jgi:enamine deaminase RidA (YjgF/YER057c/UK114 family)
VLRQLRGHPRSRWSQLTVARALLFAEKPGAQVGMTREELEDLITEAQIKDFLAALPAILDAAGART